MPRRNTEVPLLWLEFKDGQNQHWQVFLTNDVIAPYLRTHFAKGYKGCDGYCDRPSRKIFINAALPAKRQNEVVLHEIGHAVITEFIFTKLIEPAREENIVNRLTLALFPVCEEFGLRWPRRPKGYTAMHRKAAKKAALEEEE